jgi:hypothetical protein
LCFTPRNLNMDGDNKKMYPELGTIFKASHVKVILWYLTLKSIQFAESTEVAWLIYSISPKKSCEHLGCCILAPLAYGGTAILRLYVFLCN